AAEMAVPVRGELVATNAALLARLVGALTRLVQRRRTEFRSAARALPSREQLLAGRQQRLDLAAARLRPALGANARKKHLSFAQAAARLRVDMLNNRLERCAERLRGLDDRRRLAAI